MTDKDRGIEVACTTIVVCAECAVRIRAITRWEETSGIGWVTPRDCDTCDKPSAQVGKMRFFRYHQPILQPARELVKGG